MAVYILFDAALFIIFDLFIFIRSKLDSLMFLLSSLQGVKSSGDQVLQQLSTSQVSSAHF